MTPIVTIVNQKGGVGKTTTTVNLATALAAIGKKVLIVDLDPQGNASTSIGISTEERRVSIYDVLIGRHSCKEAILRSEIPNVDIIAANIHLSAASSDLMSFDNREYILQTNLLTVQERYEVIFIDCPPALGILTVNALAACSHVLIPLQCEFLAMEGLAYLLHTIGRIKQNFNSNIKIAGILLTMYDKRNKLATSVSDEVREEMGKLVYDVTIPRNVRLAEAPSHAKPAIVYDMQCSGSISYMMLAKEFWEKL